MILSPGVILEIEGCIQTRYKRTLFPYKKIIKGPLEGKYLKARQFWPRVTVFLLWKRKPGSESIILLLKCCDVSLLNLSALTTRAAISHTKSISSFPIKLMYFLCKTHWTLTKWWQNFCCYPFSFHLNLFMEHVMSN